MTLSTEFLLAATRSSSGVDEDKESAQNQRKLRQSRHIEPWQFFGSTLLWLGEIVIRQIGSRGGDRRLKGWAQDEAIRTCTLVVFETEAMMNPSQAVAVGNPELRVQALLAAYEEVCKSYHAIDEFRMKLLGLLPLASLGGLILLGSDKLLAVPPSAALKELIGFSALFASALTLALFDYEIRGIRRCHHLITEGLHLEQALGIGHGQFHVCAEEHADTSNFSEVSNSKFAACAIYSIVFAGWLFIALRFGFGIESNTCSLCAIGVAVLFTLVSYLIVRKWTAP